MIDLNKWLIEYLFKICNFIYEIFNIISYLTNTISYLLNINLQTPNMNFVQKYAFESGLLFSRDIAFFHNLPFFLFSAEPLYQNVRIDHRIIYFFGKKVTNHGKILVESWFLFLFALIWDYSFILIVYRG